MPFVSRHYNPNTIPIHPHECLLLVIQSNHRMLVLSVVAWRPTGYRQAMH